MSSLASTDMLIQVDSSIKSQAEPILEAIGLSFNDVFNLLLRQISLKKRIPFDLSAVPLTENGYTPEFEAKILATANDLYASVADGTAKIYNNASELFEDMDAEDDECERI